MTPELCAALARYNHWMNDKFYAICAELSDEDRKKDRGAFFKSIHGTLNHLLLADRIWMARFTGNVYPVKTMADEVCGDFAQLRAERTRTDSELTAWIQTLSAEALARPVQFKGSGQVQEYPLWQAVAHLLNHQTHHRGQVSTLLMQASKDPGVTDLIALFREENANAS